MEYKEESRVWFSIEKNRTKGDLIVAYSFLMKGTESMGSDSSQRCTAEGAMDTSWNIEKILLDQRKIYYCEGGVGCIEALWSLHLWKSSKASLNMALSHLFKLPALSRRGVACRNPFQYDILYANVVL